MNQRQLTTLLRQVAAGYITPEQGAEKINQIQKKENHGSPHR